MSVYGNALMWGRSGGSNAVGVLYGYSIATTAGNRGTWRFVNDDLATVSSNILTLTGAGTYTVTFAYDKVYTGQSSAGTVEAHIYHGSTELTTSPATITAAAGDTIRIQTKSSVNTARVAFTVMVEKVTA